MPAGEVSVGCEIAVSHFIDEDQAQSQIEQCERMLANLPARDRAVQQAREYLAKAREFLEAGLFTKAFLYAIRARGLDVEMLPPSRH